MTGRGIYLVNLLYYCIIVLMPSLERRVDPLLEERAHRVFGRWLLDHTHDGLISQRPYDYNDPYQDIERVRIPPQPNLIMAEHLGRANMGNSAFQKLSDSFKKYHIVDICQERHRNGKSTLISTLHLKYVFDTAMTHNNLYVTSGGDPGLARINDVISNPMMSRMDFKNQAVYRILTAAGGITEALPTEGAAQYGMAADDIQTLERLQGAVLKGRLEKGVVCHWSLPGTRARRIDGKLYVKKVPDGIANIVRKRLDWAVPVPMDVEFGNTKLEVLEPRLLSSVEDVHSMMEQMVAAASELTGEPIRYGLPGETN